MNPIITLSETFDSNKAHIEVHILVQGVDRVYYANNMLLVRIFFYLIYLQ